MAANPEFSIEDVAQMAGFSPEEVENAKRRASDLTDTLGKDALQGMEDMRKLSTSIGLPLPRCLVQAAIRRSSATVAQKKQWMETAAEMAGIKELGAIEVKIPEKKKVAYLTLGRCGADHDLGKQLEPLYSLIGDQERDRIRKELSVLVLLGRQTYNLMRSTENKFLDEIKAKLPEEVDFAEVEIDPANTTFSLKGLPADRVGIFIEVTDL
jgi:hypothetical protein